MAKRILIVDSDQNFSTILKEGLNNHPAFEAQVVHTGADAVRVLVDKDQVDLIIVDMGVVDADPAKLVEAARELYPEINVMIIPYIGQEVPEYITALGIQGSLPKPFFVGALPKLVGQAIGLDLEEEIPDLPSKEKKKSKPKPRPKPKKEKSKAENKKDTGSSDSDKADSDSSGDDDRRTIALPTLPAWKLESLRRSEDVIIEQLRNLNLDVNAEVTLLTAGAELIAKAGNMPDDRAQELAILVAESAEANSRAASFLGERDKRFEQSLHEGDQYKLYTYGLAEGIYLSLALGSRVTVGMLRHQAKRTAKDLMKYID